MGLGNVENIFKCYIKYRCYVLWKYTRFLTSKYPRVSCHKSYNVINILITYSKYIIIFSIYRTYRRWQQPQSDAPQQMRHMLFPFLRIEIDPAQAALPHRFLVLRIQHIIVYDVVKVVQTDAHNLFALLSNFDEISKDVFSHGRR